MRNFPFFTPPRVVRMTSLLTAFALAVPITMAQSAPGGTIVGATTKDDVGGQGRSIAAAVRYFTDGGKDTAIRRAQVMSYYLNNQFTQAANEVSVDIQAAENSGAKPGEEQFRLLLSCAKKRDDKAPYASAMEKYVAHYPKPR